MSRTGKAMNFKFGKNNKSVHPNLPRTNVGEKESWAYPGTAHFWGYPLLSREWDKLQISNLATTFTGSIGTKAHEKIWRKGSVGVSRYFRSFWETPYYLRNGKSHEFQIWPVHLQGPSEEKPVKISEKREHGCIQGLPNFSAYHYYLGNG